MLRDESPWCSRFEAASYLGYEDTESVDSRLVQSDKAQPGKIRFRRMATGKHGRHLVRCWKADVFAILKPFEE